MDMIGHVSWTPTLYQQSFINGGLIKSNPTTVKIVHIIAVPYNLWTVLLLSKGWSKKNLTFQKRFLFWKLYFLIFLRETASISVCASSTTKSAFSKLFVKPSLNVLSVHPLLLTEKSVLQNVNLLHRNHQQCFHHRYLQYPLFHLEHHPVDQSFWSRQQPPVSRIPECSYAIPRNLSIQVSPLYSL